MKKNIAGVNRVSDVISLMMKHAFSAAIALLALSLPLLAQETPNPFLAAEDQIGGEQLRITGEIDPASALTLYRPDLFSSVDGSVLIHGLPVLTLLDGRRFPISGELGRMGLRPLDLFPTAFLNSVEVQKVESSPVYGSDAAGGIVNLRSKWNYTGGEVGVFYGKSGGKYGREDIQTYIIGGVGNDKVQITAGASYEESSGRIPRFSR